MASDCAFVYVVCGDAVHMRTLHRSLAHLRARTRWPILVVTDLRRNAAAIEHGQVIDIRTPDELDHRQASIFLKTGLPRWLDAGPRYAYLDSDIIAVADGVDEIFAHHHGPVTFAHDLTHLASRVRSFSPWAMRCPCDGSTDITCTHLTEAIAHRWGVAVDPDWQQWNGGVFVFGSDGAAFMQMWHERTMEIFGDPAWTTRDQGTLIATVWSLGLQRQPCLPYRFNVIVCKGNRDLTIDGDGRMSVHAAVEGEQPQFLHLMDAALDDPDWQLASELHACRDSQRQYLARAEGEVGAALTSGDPWLSLYGDGRSSKPASAHAVGITDAAAADCLAGWRVVVTRPCLDSVQAPDIAEHLVETLCRQGIDARLLLTETDSDRVQHIGPHRAPRATLPATALSVERSASWGRRWGQLISTLEALSPCVHLPVGDWRHAVVAPRLSARVPSVGLVRPRDPADLDQWARLGDWWAAVLAVDERTAVALRRIRPDLASRVWVADPWTDAGLQAVLRCLARTAFDAGISHGPRPPGPLLPPPAQVGSSAVFTARYARGVSGVGVFPSMRDDYDDFRDAAPATICLPAWRAESEQLLGVVMVPARQPQAPMNRVLDSLVPFLAEIDRPAQVLAMAGQRELLRGRPIDTQLPWLEVEQGAGGGRARLDWLHQRLGELAPCVLLTSDDSSLAEIEPALADRLAIVGRVDDDSMSGLSRAARRARHWSMVVAGSVRIAERLAALDRSLASRTVVIPAPVAGLPPLAAPRSRPLAWHGAMTVLHDRLSAGSAGARRLNAIRAALDAVGKPAGLVRFVELAAGTDVAANVDADVWLALQPHERWVERTAQAMAAGCVPVALCNSTDRWMSTLVRDAVNGIVRNPARPADAANALLTLQSNPAYRRLLAVSDRSAAAALLGEPASVLALYGSVLDRALHRAVRAVWTSR